MNVIKSTELANPAPMSWAMFEVHDCLAGLQACVSLMVSFWEIIRCIDMPTSATLLDSARTKDREKTRACKACLQESVMCFERKVFRAGTHGENSTSRRPPAPPPKITSSGLFC